MDGNPIDDILTSTEKALGVTFTPEEREQMKAKYKGNAELAFQDMINSAKKFKNLDFTYKERVDMKSKYKVPLAWVDVMALSENPEMKSDIKNKAGESSAAGYWQVTKVHEPYIKQMYGVSHDDFLKDANIQERYVREKLEPEYDRNLSNYRNIAAEGIKEGRYKDFEDLMVKGKFTDDQIKALNHVLGPEGSAHFLRTGTFLGTNPERKARDVKRTLGEVINIRKIYGVPSFISDQYDFGDVETTASLPAAEDKVEETPAPKGAMPPGRTVEPIIDWSKGTVTNINPVTKQPIKPTKKEEKPATKIGYVPPPGPSIVNQYQVTTQGESSQNAGEYFQSGVLNKEYIKQQKLLEEQNRNRQEFIDANANLKNIGTSYEGYTKPVNEFDLTPEEIKARDEIQQKFTNESTVAKTSEYLLKDQFGEGVIKDIQNVLTNNANYIKTINTLEEKLKAKYKDNTPAKIDFGPLAERKNEISENIKSIGAQINAIDSQLDGIQKRLDELDNDPNITPARYNVLNANLVLEYNSLLEPRRELVAKGVTLEKDIKDIEAQQNVIIDEYNKKIRAKESEFANDPDVKELDSVYNKYKENWSKIDDYKKSPYFDSYLNSISTLTELRDTYKNLFPDKVRGEERANELARLAKDIVTEKKSDYWTPKNALYDIYYGLKSFVADAPAVGVFSTAMNALNSATFNFIGDFLGTASSIADLIGEEETARTLRAGYFATRTRVEQDVAKGAVRSDIVGNPKEFFYTVKEKDTPLLGVGFSVGDKIVVEDGAPVLYRDSEDFKINLLNPNANAVAKDFLKGKENQIEEDFSLARTTVSALPSIIDMMSLIGFNYAAIPRISRFITNKGLRTAAGLTANFGAQTFQQYGDTYQSYLDKGQSAPKAAKYAFGQSAGVALIELFNPLEMKIASLGGEAARSQFRKVLDTTVDLYSRGELGTKDFLNSIIMGLVVIPGIEMSKEALTEIVQGIFENHVENFALNENKSYTFNEGLNTTFTTLAVTFIPSMLLGRAYYKNAKADVITSAIYNAAKDPDKFEADILKALKDGKMDMSNTAGIIDFVGYIKEELDIYENLTDDQGAALSGLIGTRYSLENKKKNSNNDVVKKKIDEQIKEINAEIEEVASGRKKPEVDPFVEPLYKEKKAKTAKEKAAPTAKKAYDFDGTLFDNKTGKLTQLGEDVKKRIEAGEDVVVVTAREEGNIQEIQDALGIGADKIEATGDEKKKAEALQKRGISVQDYFDADKKKLDAIQGGITESQAAAGLTKEQQTELDKVNKRAERIQRTLQEDAEVQEEGDEPLLTVEQKKKLETELQTLNQRKDAIQKQSTAEVPVQSGAQGRQGVGGQVQAESQGPTREGKGEGETEAKGKAEEETIDSFIAQQATDVEVTLALDDVNSRMNNAEYIEEAELNKRADQLYSIWDKIDSNPNLTEDQKENLKSKVETQIQKLEQYELATAAKVGETTQTRTVKGPRVIGTTTKKSPSKYEVTPERIAETKTTTVTDKNGKQKSGTWEVLPNGSLQVTDAKGNVVPVVDGYSFKETVKDKDGNVISAVLEDKGTGTTFTIDNPDLALDIAIKAKEMELGPIEEGVFESVLQEVKVKAEPILTRESKQAPQATKAEVDVKKADIEKRRQEKYNTQYNALVSGQVLDNAGDPVYEGNKGIVANGLSTLTDKKYGHGHIRTSGLDSLNVLESLLDGSDFKGDFGKIGTGDYSTWESGKFIIVSNSMNPTTNNKLNLTDIEIILNSGLSPFAQELANKYPNVVFKDFNGKKYDAKPADQKQASQATKAEAPAPTPTTTEKVAPEAGKAPQKANTVQGVELTKKDGTKAAPAEYRKNEKGNWGKVNAKGGVTPVSSPAQVKQLEDALSSQAAAETKKTEPTPAKAPNALKDVESTAKALEGVDENKLPLARDIAANILKEYEASQEEVAKLQKERENLTEKQIDSIIKKSGYKKSEKYPDKYEFSTGASIKRKSKEQIIDDYYDNKIKKVRKDAPKEKVLEMYKKQDRAFSTPKAIAEAYHKAKKDNSNPALVEAVEDLLGVAPSQPAAETQATEAQTATAETVLEPIGKTSAEREKQIEKFFTAAAGKDKAESSQMAKLTNNIWNSVAKFFGARNAQTANQWIQSKVALIGKTTTTEAGKLGTPRFQNIPALQDVESTAKALENLKGSNQFLKTAKRIMPNVGMTGGAIVTDVNGVELAEVEVKIEGDNAVVLENIVSKTAGQGKGFGTKALDILKNIADIHGVRINLYPEPIKLLQVKGLDKDALIKFYEKNGFKYWKALGQNVYKPKTPQEVAEAYHKAKKDGSNPELVSAVEGLLAPGVQFQGDTDNPYTFAEAAEAVANNLITEIDRMIKERSNLANIKKRGFTKSQAAAQVRDLRKIKEDLLQAKKDPKWQVDAYHGTPYVFDKFTTEKIGTGEGAQAFGWGLYFTDLESIARNYAEKLSDLSVKGTTFSSILKSTKEPLWNTDKIIKVYNILKQKAIDNNTPIKDFNTLKSFIESDYLYEFANGPFGRNKLNREIGSVDGFFNFADDVLRIAKENKKNLKLERSLYKTSLFKGKKPGDYTLLEWDKPLTKEQKRRIAEQGIKEGITSLAYLNENGVPTLNTSNEITAESYYKELQKSFLLGSPKEASLFLLRAGIDGIKYPAESISRGATADTARGFNYVIFDENDVAIEERVQFQQDAAKFRAAVITTAQNKLIVAALESPNASSFVHEGFHMFEGDLTAAEKQTIIDSYNDSFGEKETEFTTDVSEWGARMWEKYFSNGRQLTAAEVKDTKKRKALQDIFDNFTEWLKGVYEGVINYTNTKGVTKEVNIAPEVQALFDNIMGITTTPTPIAAETQVEAEAKTAEELSADIEADIEAAEAKEQEAMAKAFKGNKKQTAANDLIKNPKSAQTLPQDLLEELYNLAAEAKYTPLLKKKCD